MKKNQKSIHEYLDLSHRAWFCEFSLPDFGPSVTKLLELPQEIYQTRQKVFFLAFMNSFLQRCAISFILRKYNLEDSKFDRIELALLGYWEERQYAIPLWILKDLLLGFDVIADYYFEILDSEPLTWPQRKNDNQKISLTESSLAFLTDDFFQGEKVYFKLEGSSISVTRYFNELELLDRIARAKIPEIDEVEDS
ncbi:MAG: hypothetical protein ACFFC6_11625 [Promethearchaeota archaeon]